MALLDQLFFANFRGVPFLLDASEKTAGRKTVTHEFPNKKFRYVEDLGQNLRTFNITGTITDPLYFIKRLALENALDQEGIGVLTHPYYGVANVVCTSYTIAESPKTLGECIFTMVFQEAYANIFPENGGDDTSTLSQLLQSLYPYFQQYIASQFTTFFKRNISDAADKITAFTGAIGNFSTPPNTVDNALDIFTQQKNDLNANKYSLIENPDQLGNSLTNIMQSYNDLGKSDQDSYTLSSNLFGFGFNDVHINPTTQELKERINNRTILNNTINGTILINLYQSAILIPYKDDQQLLAVSDSLEQKYQSLIYNNLPENIYDQLQDVRNRVRTFLDELKVSISKVIQVIIPRMTLSNLLYMYYDGFDNEQEILSINDIYDPTAISGTINIITQS